MMFSCRIVQTNLLLVHDYIDVVYVHRPADVDKSLNMLFRMTLNRSHKGYEHTHAHSQTCCRVLFDQTNVN